LALASPIAIHAVFEKYAIGIEKAIFLSGEKTQSNAHFFEQSPVHKKRGQENQGLTAAI